jgi:hypothetical protein
MKVKDIIRKLKQCDKNEEVYLKIDETLFLIDVGEDMRKTLNEKEFVYMYPIRLEPDHARRVNVIKTISLDEIKQGLYNI